MRFRRKPPEVEAIQYLPENLEEVRNFCALKDPSFLINLGIIFSDFIVKHNDGQIEIVSKEMFEKIYEKTQP